MESNIEKINKVILIGGNNHSGLGLVRSFGVNGIKPYGIIVSSQKQENNFVEKSRYWKKIWRVDAVEKIIGLLLSEFGEETLAPVLIPWSDTVEAYLDSNLNELRDKFIVPSIKNEQGAICALMNKYSQIGFAKKHGIPVAKTWILELNDINIPNDIVFPCIIKPVASYEGNKLDIEKCESLEELKAKLSNLKDKGYERILVQEFLNFDFEYVCSGCCGREKAYFVSRNVRSWPIVGGTGSFAQCTDDDGIHMFVKQLMIAMQEEGYNGLFDIEIFLHGNEIYLNEINWRIGGKNYLCMGTGVHYAVIWYYSVIGKETLNIKHISTDTTQFCMDEATDFRHIIYGELSCKQWMRECKKTKNFALWFMPDLRPVFNRYMNLLKKVIRKERTGKG